MWNRNKLQACVFSQQTTQNLIINAFIRNCHHQVGDQVTSTSEITQLLWLLKVPLFFQFAQYITSYAEDHFLVGFYAVQWFIYFDVELAAWKPPCLKTLINNQRATSKITTPLTTTTKLNKSQHVRSIDNATLRELPKQFRKKDFYQLTQSSQWLPLIPGWIRFSFPLKNWYQFRPGWIH